MSSTPLASSETGLLRGRLDAAYGLVMPMSGLDLLGCCLIAWVFWGPGRVDLLVTWLIGNAAISAVRIATSRRYRSGGFAAWPLQRAADLLVALAALSGLMWGGMLAWVMATGSGPQVVFVLCVALAALALSIAHIVYWPIYAVYAVPISLGAAIGFALSGRPGGLLLAFGAAMMAVVLLPISRRLASEVLRGHQLATDNQALIDSLAERSRALEAACRTLEHASRTDPLTGLANRRSRDDRLAAEWERAARLQSTLAVIAIDVDHFKRYNDIHGHAAGDRCLRAVATLLRGATRGAIDLACRHGGEEFMLILPALEANAAASMAERVRVRIAHGTADPALRLPERVTVSLGVALTVPSAAGAPHDLMAAADAALYRAKLAGRNRYEMAEMTPGPMVTAAA